MSEGKGSGQKTEKPTPKKLRDARKKGQVAKTEEAPTVMKFIVVTVFLFMMAGSILHALEWLISETFYSINQPLGFALSRFWVNLQKINLHYFLPFLCVLCVMVYFVFIIQVGFLFSTESIKPSLKKISPLKGIKNIFSKKKAVWLGEKYFACSCFGGDFLLSLDAFC